MKTIFDRGFIVSLFKWHYINLQLGYHYHDQGITDKIRLNLAYGQLLNQISKYMTMSMPGLTLVVFQSCVIELFTA